MRTAKKRIGPVAAAAMVGVAAIALSSYFQPMPVAADQALLQTSPAVRVERSGPALAFLPAGPASRVGIAFYPGARVPPAAYAYLGRACAEAGYVAVFPAFPLNFAVFDPRAAAKAEEAYPGVERWVVGGHSLGGAMACSYAADHRVAGLFLLAAYPGGRTDLSAVSLPAVSVSASGDGLAAPREIARSRGRMPAGARYVEINGGNHAQFGEYGPQKGDGPAEIAGPVQRGAVVEEALSFLRSIESREGKAE